ncbi:MAG: hypothetical protein CM1200mP2_13210 [Planctomycetaceae bacterium]|nr:MAG: hypothetical protein CM1200mP2_13210 [Planctomycetaceae bacterium]
MLVDPIRSSGELGYYETFAGVLAEGRGCTEAVVLDEEKSGGGRPTDRFLFDELAHRLLAEPLVMLRQA